MQKSNRINHIIEFLPSFTVARNDCLDTHVFFFLIIGSRPNQTKISFKYSMKENIDDEGGLGAMRLTSYNQEVFDNRIFPNGEITLGSYPSKEFSEK